MKHITHIRPLLFVLAFLVLATAGAANERITLATPPGGGPGVSTAAADLEIPFAGDPEPGWQEREDAALLAAYQALLADKAAPYDDLGGDDVLVYTLDDIYDSDMAIASNGDIYIAIEVYNDISGMEIRILRSTDGGDTFSYWERFYDAGLGTTYSRPSLIVAEGAQDRLFLAYRYKTPTSYYEIHVVSSGLTTTPSFGAPVTVMAVSGSNFDYPDLASDNWSYNSYYLYLVAEDNDSDGGDIWYARSTNQGTSFESAYEIGTLPLSDREYNRPKVCYGYGGYVHVGWTFYPRAGATFDAAARTRRCPGSGGGGLASWEAIVYLSSSSDGIDDYDVHLAASTSSNDVIVAHRRIDATNTVQTAGFNVSSDAGDNYGPQTLLPIGSYSIEDMAYQGTTGDFIIYGSLGSSYIEKANRADPYTWSGIAYFGDVAYFNGIGTEDAMALDPSRDNRVAVCWPYIGYDYDLPVKFYFDAEWRADPGYPNLEDGFPLALAAAPISPPALVDLDHDGDLEIVYSDASNQIVALHHDGSPLAGWPVNAGTALTDGPVAIGNMGLGDRLSVLAGTNNGRICGYWEDGSPMDGFPYQMPTADPAFVAIGALGGPYVRTAAVVCGGRVRFLNHKGEMPLDTFGFIFSTTTFSHAPAIGDIDGDGVSEVVAAGNNRVVAVRMYTPVTQMSYTLSTPTSGAPTLADLDLDGDVEVVVPGLNGTLTVLDGDGTNMPGWPQTMASGSPLTSAALANVLGTMEPEIAFAEQDWTVNLYFANGASASSWPEETTYGWYIYGGPIIARVDGSVSADVIIGARDRRIWSWNNMSALIPGWPRATDDVIHLTPALGDLDQDGSAEVVYLSQSDLYVVDINNTLNTGVGAWPMSGFDPQRTGCLNCSEDILTAVGDDRVTRLSFAPPAPNPSAGQTTFSYILPERARVRLEIFDLRGRRVDTVVKTEQTLGPQTVSWSGRDDHDRPVAGGTYFARLTVDGPKLSESQVRKLVILK